MGVVSSNFKATVTFGGVVSNSFKSSSESLTKGITDAETAVARLTKKQEALAQQIKKGALAGKDVSRLKRQYTELGKSIEEANDDAEKLNRTLRLRQVWTAPMRGAAGIGRAGLGAAMSGAGPLLGAATGLVGGALAINATTAEQAGVAQGYGVDLNTFKAWDAVGKQIGMNGEAFGDLAEELANKVGEFKVLGEQSSVSDAFKGLGINSSILTGKTNEEQMALILNQAQKIGDEQVARSMIDMIMGGEGNKILTFMRLSGKTYEQLIAEQQKYILTTKEGEQGAVRGQMALGNLWTAISSASQEVIGVLIGELAPSITKYANEFSNWFRTGGKDILVGGVEGFVAGISDFWTGKLQPVLLALWRGLQILAEKISEWWPTADQELKKTKTGEAAYQIGWRESEVSQRKAAENRGEDFVFSPEQARQDALAMKQRWEEIQTQRLHDRAIPVGESKGQFSVNQRFMNATQSPSEPSRPATPVEQKFPISVTVQAAPGNEPVATGKIVAAEIFNVLRQDSGGSSIMTPASLGG